MRPVNIAALVAAAFVATASAQSLATLPQPGLWEEDVQMLVNGQDVMARMRQAQAEMLKKLTPEQRKMVESMPNHTASGPSRSCLDAAKIAEFADPRKALAKSMKEQPHCKSDIVSVSGGTVKYKVRCDDPHGTTGDFNGEYSILDAKHWTYTMEGTGQMAAHGAPGAPAAQGPVAMKTSARGTWISADCGSVQPD
ncbi:MAG: hypothetical protein JWQ90_4771 [Hydrocarboniphaga sp.]|uniref:DUF3617 domain-containing protein n=1 Tax=Hydrocarboniphaga sp. TaxID=2033016 RepID=UPI0026302BA0|nr:DUF3617 family protein [Hydrocarboniphaga sp.]MDB5972321.1 hypothetical protein [Hydrocarboniphaga sp.]